MNTNKTLLAVMIQLSLQTVALAGDVEIHLPSASDAMTVDQPAGTELMRVNGDGHVGIGTAIPASALDIQGSENAFITLRDGDAVKDENSHHVGIRLKDGNDQQTGFMGFGTSVEGLSIQNLNDDGGIHMSTGGNANQVVIAADGNVGIGVTSPAGKLDVRDDKGRLGIFNGATVVSRDSNNVLTVRNTSTSGGNLSQIVMERGNGSGDGMSLSARHDGVNGVEALSVSSQGNVLMSVLRAGSVGINTIAPSDGTANGGQTLKLDVAGAIGATHFCDENGENCVVAAALSSGGDPACEDISVRASGVASAVATGTWVTLPIAGEDFDTDNAFDTGAGTYTIPKAGKYRIAARVNGGDFLTHPVFLGARVTLNGQSIAPNYQTSDNSLVYPIVEINTLRELNVNDVLAIEGYHNSGASKNMAVLEFSVSFVNTDCGNGTSGGSSAEDNLGDHTATQNIDLVANKLVGNGGTEGVSVAANGSVGIGTTTPSARLDVSGGITSSGESANMIINNTGPLPNGMNHSLQSNGTEIARITGYTADDAAGSLYFGVQNGSGIQDALSILSTGNVGIGTNNPQEPLEVAGGRVLVNSGGVYAETRYKSATSSGDWSVGTGGSIDDGFYIYDYNAASADNNRLYIDSNGNTRIGEKTAAPLTSKLDVAGNIKVADEGAACDADHEGQIRYEATLKKHQGCNGTSWNNLY